MDKIPLISNEQKNVSGKSRFKKKSSEIDKTKFRSPNNGNRMKRNKRNFLGKAKAAIYIGHIPHGFYEDEMSAYFNQFGKVRSAVVIRSKKTGRSRGYGFVEFEDEEVAKIAAESMNNYLMFNRVLKCRYIAPEERNKITSFRKIYSVPARVKNRNKDSANKKKALQALNQSSYEKKAQKKIDAFKKFFKERGIDFSFKVNFANSEDNKTDEWKNAELTVTCGAESENVADDEFGVLEIDESDNEIRFKTPPQVKKVIKRSSSRTASSAVHSKIQTQQEKQGKKLKNSSVTEIKKTKASERKKTSNGIGKKLEKATKTREKPLVKCFKRKKGQSKKVKLPRKNNAAMVSQKKGKAKEKKLTGDKGKK